MNAKDFSDQLQRRLSSQSTKCSSVLIPQTIIHWSSCVAIPKFLGGKKMGGAQFLTQQRSRCSTCRNIWLTQSYARMLLKINLRLQKIQVLEFCNSACEFHIPRVWHFPVVSPQLPGFQGLGLCKEHADSIQFACCDGITCSKYNRSCIGT